MTIYPFLLRKKKEPRPGFASRSPTLEPWGWPCQDIMVPGTRSWVVAFRRGGPRLGNHVSWTCEPKQFTRWIANALELGVVSCKPFFGMRRKKCSWSLLNWLKKGPKWNDERIYCRLRACGPEPHPDPYSQKNFGLHTSYIGNLKPDPTPCANFTHCLE